MKQRPYRVVGRGLAGLAAGLLLGWAAAECRIAPLPLTSPALADPPTALAESIDDTLELTGLEKKFQAVAARAASSVVAISAACDLVDSDDAIRSDEMSFSKLQSIMDRTTRIVGTGCVIDADGYILTNEHVVGEAEQLWVTTDDRRIYPAIVVGSDPRADLAVLKIPATGLPVASFAADARIERGMWTIALGNPYGLSAEGEMCLSVGVVSATERSLPKLASKENRLYSNLIQTTAQINPGNSGGPLLDLQGRIIGINTAVILPQKQTNGIGFAMPVTSALLKRVEDLREGREAVYGYLGVMASSPTPRQRQEAGIKDAIGASIDSVEADSPASAAQLQPGDVVTALAGRTVRDGDELVRLVGEAPVNQPLALRVYRSGKEMDLNVSLRKRQLPVLAVNKPKQRLRWKGMVLGPVPEHWQGEPKEKAPGGVMVFGVEKGSAFLKQGVAAGTIITSVAGQAVGDLLGLQQVLNQTPAEQCKLEFFKSAKVVATAGE